MAGYLSDVWYLDWQNNKVYPVVDDVMGTPITVGSQPKRIAVDKNNIVWVYCDTNYTLYKIENFAVTSSFVFPGAGSAHLAVDKNNILWIAHTNGLYKVQNDTLTLLCGLAAYGGVGPICIDKNNTIWISANTVMLKFIAGVYVSSSVSTANGQAVRCDSNNVVWATAASGMYPFINGVQQSLVPTVVPPYELSVAADGVVYTCGYSASVKSVEKFKNGISQGAITTTYSPYTGTAVTKDGAVYASSDNRYRQKIVNGTPEIAVIGGATNSRLQLCGDATGVQWNILFGGSASSPQHQAMTGGM